VDEEDVKVLMRRTAASSRISKEENQVKLRHRGPETPAWRAIAMLKLPKIRASQASLPR